MNGAPVLNPAEFAPILEGPRVLKSSKPAPVEAWTQGDVSRMIREPATPMPWALEGMLPLGVSAIMASNPNLGKSSSAMMMAVGIATGIGALGREVSLETPQGALFFGLEDDEHEFHRRMQRLIGYLRTLDTWSPSHEERLAQRFKPFFPNRRAWGDWSLERHVDTIIEAAGSLPDGCGLIVLDTLSRLMRGDQNSADAVRPFLEAQSTIAEVTGATVLPIHHLSKGNDFHSDKGLYHRLHPENMRGSSALEASERAVLTLGALSPNEANKAGLDPTKAQRSGYVACYLGKAMGCERGDLLIMERIDSGAPGAGFLLPRPDSDELLAKITGPDALVRHKNRERVLLLIADQGGNLNHIDVEEASQFLFGESHATDKSRRNAWDKCCSELRSKGWLNTPLLTQTGWAQVEILQGRA